LLRWRSDIRSDGAKRFSEVEGGLNQMTIGRFERLVQASPFKLIHLEPVPIRPLRRLHTRAHERVDHRNRPLCAGTMIRTSYH
jgi:hypothetical protein